VSSMCFVFFFSLCLVIHLSCNLAQLCFLVHGKMWKWNTLRFSLGPQTLSTLAVKCFGGAKIKKKKKFACQPACVFKGLPFIG